MLPTEPNEIDELPLVDVEEIQPEMEMDSVAEDAGESTESELSEQEIHDILFGLAKQYIIDNMSVRENQLVVARRNNNYWKNYQDIWYDAVAHDWRRISDPPEGYDDYEDYDSYKFVNLYKGHGEAIIAALSSQVPSTRFFPEDADNAKDVATAKAYSGIAELNRKNDEAKLLLVRILCILFNEHFCAIYNYVDRNSKYGQVTVPREGEVAIRFIKKLCSNCGAELNSEQSEPEEILEGQELLQSSEVLDEESYCPECNSLTNPILDTSYDKRQGIVDYEQVDKIKICRKAYGITNVSFPAYCKTQDDIPFLSLELNIDVAKAIEEYSELYGQLGDTPNFGIFSDTTYYAGINQDYLGEIPKYTCIKRCLWLRPWAFNRIGTKEYTEKLKELFPDGVKLVFFNEILVEAVAEKLDDHWTISVNPQYNELTGEPIGNVAIPLQDVANNLLNLTEDTVAHGISETFASTEVLDFERYKANENKPGSITPTKSPGQNSLGAHFHQLKSASLSPEIAGFDASITEKMQFVLGAFPSIYGGTMSGGSNTLGEYQESRTQALQRLQLVWVTICKLWSDMEYKSVREFANELNYDDKQVQKAGTGYKNVWIKQIDLEGEVVNIEPESADYFPVSWSQKKNIIDSLMQQKSPFIDSILTNPNNISDIANAYGMGGLYIPGDDDRNKQVYEIALLQSGVPQEVPPDQMGQAQLIPSVMPDYDVDNHELHFETCKAWAVSEVGQAAKVENPEGYQNVLAHMKIHKQMMMQKMQEQMMEQQMMQPMPAGDPNAEAPIS